MNVFYLYCKDFLKPLSYHFPLLLGEMGSMSERSNVVSKVVEPNKVR